MANEIVSANGPSAPGRRHAIKRGAALAAGFVTTASGLGLAMAEENGSDERPAGNSLKYKGINYDVGTNYFPGHLSRQIWNRDAVRNEIRVIREELYCNSIGIFGTSIERLVECAELALQVGLQVWLQPRLMESTQQGMLLYLANAARAAEKLRRKNGNVTLNVGCELSLFLQGFVPGGTFMERMEALGASWQDILPGMNKALNAHLEKACAVVRANFKGAVTYGAGEWEMVEWSMFNIVGINYYRSAENRRSYIERLKELRSLGKPVVITEFGCCTYEGAEERGGSGYDIIDYGKEPPQLNGSYVRSEKVQADEILALLEMYEQEKIEGAFVYQFLSEFDVYSPDPHHDLDLASHAIVKVISREPGSETIGWEPKEAFHALARFYAKS